MSHSLSEVRTRLSSQWRRGWGAARHRFSLAQSGRGLRRLDERSIPSGTDEIRLFTKLRNEATRLPYFFDYYRGLGVDRFFLVDNLSTDNTVKIALDQPDVVVFETSEPLNRHGYWLESLLDRYGRDRWCVVADADELLVMPSLDELDLRSFAEFLESQGVSAMRALLLDMYAHDESKRLAYVSGANPLDFCDHFDRSFTATSTTRLNPRHQRWFETDRFAGGTRSRVFGVDVNLTKVPFFRHGRNVWLSPGAHAIDGVDFADVRAAMLHFKYLHDFVDRTIEATNRGVYADGGGYYSSIAKQLHEDAEPDFWFDGSVRLTNLADLLRVGILRSSPELDHYVEAHP